MITKLQIYTAESTDPYENLAIEKVLLDAVPKDGVTLYLWQNQNTVVIGRNQNPWAECRCALLEQEGGRLARRLSGGGAVFHDLGNLNFTFLCATENYDLPRQLKVLETACGLAGIRAEISGRNDVLAEGKKFSGNAFYNAKGKSYHHGTLLIQADMERLQRYLTPSKAKLKAKGVQSVRSRVVNLAELATGLTCEKMKEYMATAFEQVYGLSAEPITLSDRTEIDALAAQYKSRDYLYGTPLPLSLSCEGRFDWGTVQLQLETKDGIIRAAKVYTDAMDWQLPQTVEAALIGCRFTPQDLKAALSPLPCGADLLHLLN